MEHWNIELWENRNGVCYVEKDLLKKLQKQDALLVERLFKKKIRLTKYTISQLESSNDIENLGDGLWELKFTLPKAEIRYLGCLVSSNANTTFYALCAFRKKDQKIRNTYIMSAKSRQKEFNMGKK